MRLQLFAHEASTRKSRHAYAVPMHDQNLKINGSYACCCRVPPAPMHMFYVLCSYAFSEPKSLGPMLSSKLMHVVCIFRIRSTVVCMRSHDLQLSYTMRRIIIVTHAHRAHVHIQVLVYAPPCEH